jgi:hypothetical protein
MSQVDTVALWAGLFASIAGITLSIVATVLSIVSNNRATAVNDQTIKSLQKIESAVERLSDDSRTLIKAGWDKMLGNVGQRPESDSDLCENEEPEPLELKVITQAKPTNSSDGQETQLPSEFVDRIAQLENQIEQVRKAVATARRSNARPESSTAPVDELIRVLANISPRASALFELISQSRHLTETQYQALAKSELGLELRELLANGLLVPLTGHDNEEKSLVYWLPSRFARAAKVAIQLAPRISPSVVDAVRGELKKIGYATRQ